MGGQAWEGQVAQSGLILKVLSSRVTWSYLHF